MESLKMEENIRTLILSTKPTCKQEMAKTREPFEPLLSLTIFQQFFSLVVKKSDRINSKALKRLFLLCKAVVLKVGSL